jgi:probable phosphoglycerate mutase
MAARLYSGDPFFAPDKGESRVAFFERSITALTAIAQANPGARLIVVTHGGVLDCLWRAAHNTPLDAPRHWPLLNASLNTLAYRQERFVVLQWGDDAHLSLTLDE